MISKSKKRCWKTSEKIENVVRKILEKMFGASLPKRKLVIGYDSQKFPKTHEFDLVSDDAQIVGEIKSANSISKASYNSTLVDCLYLTKVRAKKKMLVLTNETFYRYFKHKAGGIISPEIDVVLIRIEDYFLGLQDCVH